MDIISYAKAIAAGSGGDIDLKTINGNSLKGTGNIAITTYQAFPEGWASYTESTKTTKQFCDMVDADETAVIGMGYFGGARFSDKPAGLSNFDIVVEILEGPKQSGVATKAIHLVGTSSTVYPYRWEYTYWSHGSVSGWRGVQPELVSGTNIKTINNQSLLGSGNINIQAQSSPKLVVPLMEFLGLDMEDYAGTILDHITISFSSEQIQALWNYFESKYPSLGISEDVTVLCIAPCGDAMGATTEGAGYVLQIYGEWGIVGEKTWYPQILEIPVCDWEGSVLKQLHSPTVKVLDVYYSDSLGSSSMTYYQSLILDEEDVAQIVSCCTI